MRNWYKWFASLSAVLLVAIIALAAAQNNYVTVFALTENPISETGNWISGSAAGTNSGGGCPPAGGSNQCWQDVQTFGNHAGGTGTQNQCTGVVGQDCNDAVAVLSGTWTSDQAVCATVFLDSSASRTNTNEVELHLRMTIAPHNITGYEFLYSTKQPPNQYASTVRWNGPLGQFTGIGGMVNVPALSNGDIICASAIGSTLKHWVIQGGVVTGSDTVTDATYSGGSPGIGFDTSTVLGDNAHYGWSQFEAANVVAQTANSADVTAVVNGSLHTLTNGESVLIPPGNVSWSAGVTVPPGLAAYFFGYGTPSGNPAVRGPAANCTSTSISLVGTTGFQTTTIPVGTPGSLAFSIGCMGLNYGSGASKAWSLAGVCTASNCPNIRIHNITLNNWSGHQNNGGDAGISYGISAMDNLFGVLDHNCVNCNDNNSADGFMMFVEANHSTFPTGTGTPAPNGLYGDTSWASAEGYGSFNFLFMENNLFSNVGCCENEGGAVDIPHRGGGRLVIRQNTWNMTDHFNFTMGWHGTESGGRPRSGRTWEYYQNTLNYPITCPNGGCAPFIATRGGTGLTWGQTFNNATTHAGGMGYNFLRVEGSVGNWPSCDGTNAIDGNDPNANLSTPAFGPVNLSSAVGTGYVATTGATTTIKFGSGTGLTVNTTVGNVNPGTTGNVTGVTINNGGSGFSAASVGSVFLINGGNADAAVQITAVTGTAASGITLSFFQNYYVSGASPGWTANQWSPVGAPYSLHDVTASAAKSLSVGSEITGNGANFLTLYTVSSYPSFFYNPLPGESITITRAFWCMDQSAGRGQGFQFSSQGNTTGPYFTTPSNEVVSPAYVWMNLFSNQNPGGDYVSSDTKRVLRGRDFFADNLGQPAQTATGVPFDGTGTNACVTGFSSTCGVGYGLKARRPATCANGVGYWATDEASWNTTLPANTSGDFYICGTSGWPTTATYVPAAYPHPLIQGNTVGGGGGSVTVTPATEAFGNQNVGTSSATKVATLNNTTTSPVTVNSVTVTGSQPNDFPVVTGAGTTCSGSVGANGGSCTVTTKYSPTIVGPESANLNINTSAGNFIVAMTGTGVSTGVPGTSYSPNPYSAGSVVVNQSSTGLLTITNTGTATLTVTSNVLADTSVWGTTTATCLPSNSVAPNGTCTIGIKYSPTAQVNNSTTITINSNAPTSPDIINVSGSGILVPTTIQGVILQGVQIQ